MGLEAPSSVAFRDGVLYVADQKADAVYAWSHRHPKYTLAGENLGGVQLRQPRGIALWNDLLLVADRGNSRLLQWPSDKADLDAPKVVSKYYATKKNISNLPEEVITLDGDFDWFIAVVFDEPIVQGELKLVVCDLSAICQRFWGPTFDSSGVIGVIQATDRES